MARRMGWDHVPPHPPFNPGVANAQVPGAARAGGPGACLRLVYPLLRWIAAATSAITALAYCWAVMFVFTNWGQNFCAAWFS